MPAIGSRDSRRDRRDHFKTKKERKRYSGMSIKQAIILVHTLARSQQHAKLSVRTKGCPDNSNQAIMIFYPSRQVGEENAKRRAACKDREFRGLCPKSQIET
jgi:hypothetical protein